MILEKEREEVSVPAQQPAEAIPYEPAPSGAAPRKMIKCPSKTGINMNKREKRTGEMLTLVIGLAVILLMAGLVARFGVMEEQPIVQSVELNVASTEENRAASVLSFSVRIYLRPETEVAE